MFQYLSKMFIYSLEEDPNLYSYLNINNQKVETKVKEKIEHIIKSRKSDETKQKEGNISETVAY